MVDLDKPWDSNMEWKSRRTAPMQPSSHSHSFSVCLCFQDCFLQRNKSICFKNIIDIQTLTRFKLSKVIQGLVGPKWAYVWFENGGFSIDKPFFTCMRLSGIILLILFAIYFLRIILKRSEEKISLHFLELVKATQHFALIWACKGRKSMICV